MYQNLKGLMAKHRFNQTNMAGKLGITLKTFNKRLNLKGGDFTISEGKLIQKIFTVKGENLTLDEIFFTEEHDNM